MHIRVEERHKMQAHGHAELKLGMHLQWFIPVNLSLLPAGRGMIRIGTVNRERVM